MGIASTKMEPVPTANPASSEAARVFVKKADATIESAITFTDWQAMAKVDFDFSQRKALFGEDLGKRVTWTGIYDQHNRLAN